MVDRIWVAVCTKLKTCVPRPNAGAERAIQVKKRLQRHSPMLKDIRVFKADAGNTCCWEVLWGRRRTMMRDVGVSGELMSLIRVCPLVEGQWSCPYKIGEASAWPREHSDILDYMIPSFNLDGNWERRTCYLKLTHLQTTSSCLLSSDKTTLQKRGIILCIISGLYVF